MSDTQTDPDATLAGDQNPAEVTTSEGDPEGAEADTETFPREVVEKLRRENAGYRDRANQAEARTDELARALFTARVAATGKLADATDLEFNAELLDDSEALAAAIDSLIDAKPYLKARKVSGDVGQGERGDSASTPTFADLFR